MTARRAWRCRLRAPKASARTASSGSERPRGGPNLAHSERRKHIKVRAAHGSEAATRAEAPAPSALGRAHEDEAAKHLRNGPAETRCRPDAPAPYAASTA